MCCIESVIIIHPPFFQVRDGRHFTAIGVISVTEVVVVGERVGWGGKEGVDRGKEGGRGLQERIGAGT